MPTGPVARGRSTRTGSHRRRRLAVVQPPVLSYPRPPQGFAENASRAEHQDQDQQHERHDVAPPRPEQELSIVLHHAQDEAAEQRAAQVTDAAEYRRAEGLDT